MRVERQLVPSEFVKEMETLPNDVLLDLFDGGEEEYVQQLEEVNAAVARYLSKKRKRHGGSHPGRSPNIDRDRQVGHDRILKDYFAADTVYNEELFRRRFRMRRPLFLRILDAIQKYDSYFLQKCDALGLLGLSPIQKATAAIRQLAYGLPADALDEYVRMSESSVLKSLKRFCEAVVGVFAEEYLRYPTVEDVQRLLKMNEARGFPGMLGSLDCMHWSWKNCPVAWAGQYSGKEKNPTIVLEAVSDYEGWIWHMNFGMPGSHNDINVLDRSLLFSNVANGKAPSATYTINRNTYDMGYYLADGIYPPWATLVQTISNPQGEKKKVPFLSLAAPQISASLLICWL